MTEVLSRASSGAAATHAIVIGVGAYPYLLGGAQTSARTGLPEADAAKVLHDMWNLGQLSSPPLSADAFARWLIDEFDHANNLAPPLGSLELLISQEPKPAVFTAPNGPVEVERASMIGLAGMPNPNGAPILGALQRWFDRCDEREDNLAIFYYCGHGVSRGEDTALLSDTFGVDAYDPMNDAIDFSGECVGNATRDFSERYAALATELSDAFAPGAAAVDDAAIVRAYMERNDARSFAILGDPAVKLRTAEIV